MNQAICSIEKDNNGDTYFKWTNHKTEKITLPDIRFKKLVVPKPYFKSEGDTIENIVLRDRNGCESLDERCLNYLKNLNRSSEGFLSPDYSGIILVPTANYQADIQLVKGHPKEYLIPPISSENTNIKGLHDMPKAMLNLRKYIVPHVTIAPQNRKEVEPKIQGTKQVVRKLIAFPKGVKIHNIAPVGVFDRSVYIEHCDFHENIEFIPSNDEGRAIIFGNEDKVQHGKSRLELIECTQTENAASPMFARDHGTHIVGIIGARTLSIDDEAHTVRRKIHSFQLPEESKVPPEKVTEGLFLSINESIKDRSLKVINMSLRYDFDPNHLGDNDPIQTFIKDLEAKDFLFVAAAGNAEPGQKGIHFIDSCDIRPACFGYANLISVVALDLNEENPSVLESSNRGKMFSIGAPGLSIESTTRFNGRGHMSGTSQATAIVSTAASLLMSVESRMAWEVKNRLMYTADFFPSLEDKLFSGRLNVSAALGTRYAYVEHRDTSISTRFNGDLLNENLRDINILSLDSKEIFHVHPTEIKRIYAAQGEDYAILFYVKKEDKKTLLKEKVFIKENESKLMFRLSSPDSLKNKIRSIKLKDIANYISAFQENS